MRPQPPGLVHAAASLSSFPHPCTTSKNSPGSPFDRRPLAGAQVFGPQHCGINGRGQQRAGEPLAQWEADGWQHRWRGPGQFAAPLLKEQLPEGQGMHHHVISSGHRSRVHRATRSSRKGSCPVGGYGKSPQQSVLATNPLIYCGPGTEDTDDTVDVALCRSIYVLWRRPALRRSLNSVCAHFSVVRIESTTKYVTNTAYYISPFQTFRGRACTLLVRVSAKRPVLQ